MKNTFLILLSLLLTSFSIYGQSRSKLKELAKNYPDSIEIQVKLIGSYIFQQPDTAKYFIERGLFRANDYGNIRMEATLYKTLGIWHDIHGTTDSVFINYRLSKDIYKDIGELVGYADVINNMGYSYSRRSQYQKAIPLLEEALNIYDSLNLIDKQSGTLTNLGNIYLSNNEVDQALEKYKLSNVLQIGKGMNNTILRNNSNIAVIYNRQEKYDSAIVLYNEQIAYAEKTNDLRALSINYNNISTSLEGIGETDQAIDYLEKSYSLKKQLNDSIALVSALNSLCSIYLRKGDFESAIAYGKQGLLLNAIMKITKDESEILINMAKAYGNKKDFKKASSYYEQYISFKDSADNISQRIAISDILEKYETSQRKNKISELELENNQAELSIQKSNNQRNLLLFSIIIITILVVFLIFRYRQKQKSNLLLAEKNKLISETLNEKETLLKEIHHRVKNNLQIISSLLNLQLNSINDPETVDAIKEGQNRVKSMALIHEKLYMQDNLAGINSEEYIRTLSQNIFDSYNTISDRISLKTQIDPISLEIDTVIPIALIINELITNSLKYAFPKDQEGEIFVSLSKLDDKLQLIVSDNGIGQEDVDKEKTSFGMKLVKSLARKLKANVAIESVKGTKIQLDITRFTLV